MIVLLLSVLLSISNSQITTKKQEIMKFELVKLPYASDALEPVISKQTIEFHHGKHLLAYVTKLNELIVGTPFEKASLVEIVKKSEGAIFNNAGQVLNHELFFTQFSPTGGGRPVGKLAEAINQTWGSFENFQKEFETAGVAQFGSGWVWLAKDEKGKLSIHKEANAGNPVTQDLTPILGFDVWEHSYYLDYQNRRADHLKELWKIVDWDKVNQRY
ncbi:superoxide dismutase [Parabacteroides sp. 52]|nr:Fe-Mn family superoxide dismutase [Parabacteroides sp. PM5-20]NDV55085.1 superoxide dismutase [Parabacteroides sp. 52]